MPPPLHVLTFLVAYLRCGLRAELVREILPMVWLNRVPGQPAILEGFLNVRGSILPVVRMAALFDVQSQPDVEPHIIVMESLDGHTSAHRGSLALLVDATEDVLTLDPGDLRPISGQDSVNKCAEAEFSYAGNQFTLLDGGRLLLAEEMLRIADLQQQIERRTSGLRTVL